MARRKIKLRERGSADTMMGGRESIERLLEQAWELIANAGNGNWENEGLAWRASAEAWRRDWSRWVEDHRPHRLP